MATEELNGTFTNEDGKSIDIHIKGDSQIPFWKDDLKFEAVLGLLDTIDEKNWDDRELFREYVTKLENITKTFDPFY